MNTVHVSATVLNPRVTEKRVRFDLACNDATGKATYVRAIAQGASLQAVKELIEKAGNQPIHIAVDGSLFSNRFKGQDGTQVRENVVLIDTVRRLPNGKTVKDSKGQSRLAEGKAIASFRGVALKDAKEPGEHGNLILLRQEEGKIKRFVFVRAIDGLSYKAGDVIEIQEARLARLYPRGRDNGPELGIIATSDQIKVVGSNGTSSSKKAAAKVSAQAEVEEDFGPEEDLPF